MAVRLVLATVVAATIAFFVVQDREMGEGVGRYVDAQRAALAGRGPAVSVDEMMSRAVHESVRRGLVWSGIIGAAGFGATAIVARRSRRG